MKRLFVFASAIALLGPAMGCKYIANKIIRGGVEQATGVSVDEEKGTATLTGNNGEKVQVNTGTAATKVPDGFPVAIYPGGKIVSTVAMSESTMVNVQTPDDAQKVIEFYKSKMPATKTDTTQFLSDKGGMLGWKDSDEGQISVIVGADEGANTSNVILSYTPKKKTP